MCAIKKHFFVVEDFWIFSLLEGFFNNVLIVL